MSELVFTDNEKRIFLAAVAREEKVCVQLDKENDDSDISLFEICKSIQYKVTHSELWLSDSI